MEFKFLYQLGAYFLHKDLKENEESVFFSTTVVIGMFTMAFFGVQYSYYEVWPLLSRMIESIAVMAFGLYWFYRKQSIEQATQIVMLGVFHGVIIASFWTGGVNGHKMIWIPAILFLPGFFMDLIWVLLWGAIYSIGVLALTYHEGLGLTVIQPFSVETAATLKLEGTIFAMGTALWMAWNYRRSKDSTLKSLQTQEIALIKVFRELGESRKALQSQLDENVNLVRMLTHDIANPLTVIQAWQGRLPEGSPARTRIEKACSSMLNTLSMVRDFRASKDGKINLKAQKVDLVDLVKKVLDLFADKIAEKRLKLNFRDENQKIWINGDPRIIESQILSNVLSNAIKFSHEESLIDIQIQLKGNLAEVMIRDHGIGMSSDLQSEIFLFNKKTNRPGTNGEKGTGFGMPLIKHFIESLGGQLSIQSWDIETHPKTSGTEVKITLPLLQMKANPIPPSAKGA